MKTKILSFILSVVACVGLVSCSDDTWTPGGVTNAEGSVSLASIKVDVDDSAEVVSRAGVSTDAFIVNILDKTSGEVKRTYKYGTMPEVLTLPVGDYTVSVKSHELKEAEFDAPYYVGSADFSVELGKITEIGTVFCKFSNIKVTIKYTDELLKYLGSDAKVTVIANDHGELIFSANETRAGYFAAVDDSPTLVAIFTATIEGNNVEAIHPFADVAPGKHYIITFSVKNGNATIPDETGLITASGIKVDANIASENLSGTAPAGDDPHAPVNRPGGEEWPDDPNTPDDPTPPTTQPITIEPGTDCPNLHLDGTPNALEDGASYIVDIHADSGIENLLVNITSSNEDFVGSAGEMLPLTFDLAHVDPDKTNSMGAKLVDAFNNDLGLPCNENVLGKKDIKFDVSGLVPLLGGFPGTHTFSIDVTDKDGNKRSVQLAILVP